MATRTQQSTGAGLTSAEYERRRQQEGHSRRLHPNLVALGYPQETNPPASVTSPRQSPTENLDGGEADD